MNTGYRQPTQFTVGANGGGYKIGVIPSLSDAMGSQSSSSKLVSRGFQAMMLVGDETKGYEVEGDLRFEDQCWIGPLARISLFVGPNNSGKSRLLRALVRNAVNGIPAARSAGELQLALQPISPFVGKLPREHEDRAVSIRLRRLLMAISGHRGATYFALNSSAHLLEAVDGARHMLQPEGEPLNAEQESAFDECVRRIKQLTAKFVDAELASARRVYVPVLRGVKFIAHDDVFCSTTQRNYFPALVDGKQPNGPEIWTGLTTYDRVMSLRNGERPERQRIADFESFLGQQFFEGQRVELVAHPVHKHLLIQIGDEQERAIHDLGDGLQHIIAILMPAFLYRDKPLLLFVEEPENCLHPAFQRVLIEALAEGVGSGPLQVFMTTHSNHLLDITLDYENISIFSVHKSLGDGEPGHRMPQFQVVVESTPDGSLLDALGVRYSSVLLANATIWVEGVTDRLYLRRFLQLCPGFALVEDKHYTFMEYSGSNITHIDWLDGDGGIDVERLCAPLFLIADRDDENDKAKQARHQRLTGVLGDRFYRLKSREIENLLTPEILAKVLTRLEGRPVSVAVDRDSYADVPLGKFIETTLVQQSNRRSRSGHPYAAESGTLKNKLPFAREAVAAIENWRDLSEEAQDLTRRIIAFVESRNQ